MSVSDRRRIPPTRAGTPRGAWLAILGLFLILGLLSLARHRFFLSTTLDMGFYVHDVWLAGHGEWHNTLLDIHIFQDHFSPVLYLLGPLAYLATAESLLLVQAAALALGGLGAFHLGLHHRDLRLGYLALIWYGLSVGIWYGAMYDFHPVALAVPVLLWLMLLTERGAGLWKVVATLLLLVLIREDAAVLGALVVWRSAWIERSISRLVAGLVAIGAGAAYVMFGADLFGDSGYFFWLRYADYGLSFGEVLSRLPENLMTAVTRLGGANQVITLTALFVPFLIVGPLMGWRRSWPGLLLLASNLISSYGPGTTLYFQYSLLVVPFLIWGSVAVWSRVEEVRPEAAKAAIAFTAAIFLLFGPVWHRGYGPPDRFASHIVTQGDRAAMSEALDEIPPSASVSAGDRILPHLAARRTVYPFPGPMLCPNSPGFHIDKTRSVDYVVVDDETARRWGDRLTEWGFSRQSSQNRVEVWASTGPLDSAEICPTREDIFAAEVARIREEAFGEGDDA